MKKLYMIGALALFLSPAVNAQTDATVIAGPAMQKATPEENRHSVDVDFNTVSNRDVVFSNDCSDPNDWNLSNEGQGTWEWVTEAPALMAQYMGNMASATAANGFFVFNGISHLTFASGTDVLPQESVVEYVGTETIDCSLLTDVIISFNQRYRAYNVDETFVEVSADGGSTWESIQVNADVVTNASTIQGEISINITSIAAGVSDLKIRFRWYSDYLAEDPTNTQADANSYGSGYGWMLDDISVSSPPENEVVIGTTWYQNFVEILNLPSFSDVILVDASEYNAVPSHSLQPFNFGAAVTNAGSEDQTGVQLVVVLTDPDGATNEITSDPITLTAGTTDTLWIYDSNPELWAAGTVGGYSMDFQVTQDQMDELPSNNVGVSLFTNITDDFFTGPFNGGGAVENQRNSSTQTSSWQDGSISGTRYTFDTPATERSIVAIQFSVGDLSQAGEQVFFNLRKGSVIDVDSVGYNEMELFFSYDPSPDAMNIPYIIDEADYTTDSNPVWITVELPHAIMIEPSTLYQAEVKIPALNIDYFQIGMTSGRVNLISVLQIDGDPSSGPQGWWTIGTSVFNLRLVTAPYNPLSVEDVTIDNGMKLMQNYPNPFTDQTRIQYQFDETSAATLEVYDLTGKLVFGADLGIVAQNAANSYMFNKGSLAPGMYTYSIVTANNRITRKMTIE